MLIINDISKIEIYKIKYWCIYFRYKGEHFMLRHMDECGDHWNLLTNKETWETKSSGYTLFDIRDFLKLKYSNKYVKKQGTPYKHLDVEYFVNCLVKLKLAKYENKLRSEEKLNLDINTIKPKDIKISDKYSSNLYKFLKKYNKQGYNKVYFNPIDNYDGNIIELDMSFLPFANIYIGNMIEDDMTGNSLARIVTGQSLYKLSCRVNVKDEYIDITEEFWKRYEEIGRCLFIGHNSWYQDDYNTRFTYIDEITRVCNWCGKTEIKRIEEIIRKKEIWE